MASDYSSSRQLSERFTPNEKSILFSLVSARADVLENKRTDYKNFCAKKSGWDEIAKQFNSNADVTKRTAVQLKKCWNNEKAKRKRLLATSTRERMATGGGPCVEVPVTDPELEIALAGTKHFIGNTRDSDMILSEYSQQPTKGPNEQSSVTLDHDYDVPAANSLGVDNSFESREEPATPRKFHEAHENPAQKQPSRKASHSIIERELQQRLNRISHMDVRSAELHKLQVLEAKLKVRAARRAALREEELLHVQRQEAANQQQLHEQLMRHREEHHQLSMKLLKEENDEPFIFRINDNAGGPNLLVQVCLERGWREYSDGGAMKDKWNLWWRTSGFPVNHYKQLKHWQFTNHIPRGSLICRKDNLARYLKCMRKAYGAIYDFSPIVYNLPLEYTKLVAEYIRQNQGDHAAVWICKPVGQSQGRGIFLFRDLSELCYDSNAVVQRYIQNPLLIGGYKFDLRLYVCIPSYHPLTVYVYREGLARFGTEKFSLADLDNPFCHLTNSSLNKFGPGYTEKKERVGSGCKWTLKQLRQYFHQAGISDWLLWQKVSSLIILTVLSQSGGIPNTTNCFEFYGFDVLVDSCLRPWLLEVNLSPALGNDCDVDMAVKKPMLHDMFDLLGLPVCNTGLSLFKIWSASSRKDSNGEVLHNCDYDKENSKSDVSDVKCEALSPSEITLVTVANRWKRKHLLSQESQVSSAACSAQNKFSQRPRRYSANKQTSSPSFSAKDITNSECCERKPRHSANLNTRHSSIECFSGQFTAQEEYRPRSATTALHAEPEVSTNCNIASIEKPKLVTRGSAEDAHYAQKMWGNGRNWHSPPTKEGLWTRIYPLGMANEHALTSRTSSPLQSSTHIGDTETKLVVSAVHKCSKLAREIFKLHPLLSDIEYSSILKKSLGLKVDVWLPMK